MIVKTMRKKLITERGEELTVMYRLTREWSDEYSSYLYSISVSERETGETVTASEITSDEVFAASVFDAVTKGCVTAVSLLYVIEDMIS